MPEKEKKGYLFKYHNVVFFGDGVDRIDNLRDPK